jgi:hypothetical protein
MDMPSTCIDSDLLKAISRGLNGSIASLYSYPLARLCLTPKSLTPKSMSGIGPPFCIVALPSPVQ